MEKSPVVIALLTMMMVKSVNAQIDTLSHDSNRTQPGTSSYDEKKFFKENEDDARRPAETGIGDADN